MNRSLSRAAWLACSMIFLAASCRSSGGPEDGSRAAAADVPSPAAERAVTELARHGSAARPVLRRSDVLGYRTDGTDLRPRLGSAARADVTLPGKSDGTFAVVDRVSGFGIDVGLHDARGVVAGIAQGYVAYPGALADGVDWVHRPTLDGTEDYVRFARRPASEAVAYDMTLGAEVRGLRLVDRTLELVDADGAPRLRMAPPHVVDARGAAHPARVSVLGCEVDRDPALPWGRAPVSPGAGRCRVTLTWEAREDAYPLVLDPTWTTTGNMSVARRALDGVVLGSGGFLVSGGDDDSAGDSVATAEVYDRASNTWAATGSMSTARDSHRLVLLSDGRVLAFGGENTGGVLASAEVYNPSNGAWTGAGSLANPRFLAGGVLLASGNVLAAAGTNGPNALSSAEIWNPATNTWSSTGSLATGRFEHTTTLLASGKVLVTGGMATFGGAQSSAEVYNPTSGSWSTTGAMSTTRQQHAAALLPSGQVLVSGGLGSGYLASAELYDPVAGTFSLTGGMQRNHMEHTMTLLGSGRVLVAAGRYNGQPAGQTEIWDPTSGTWFLTTFTTSRVGHVAGLLQTGDVIVAGGYYDTSQDPLNTAAFFTLSPQGVACASTSECAGSGTCVEGVCCNTACASACDVCTVALGATADGTCTTAPLGYPGAPACAPYVCAGAAVACPTTCTADNDCVASAFCSGGQCVTNQTQGASCTEARQCQSGFCSDGVCCDTACGSKCDVCAASLGASADGTCTLAPIGYAGSPVCAPYLCSGASISCPLVCSSDPQCSAGAYCRTSDSTCQSAQANGAACTEARQCQSGFCADGVCCNVACAGACDACSVAAGAAVDGTCAPVAAGSTGQPSCSPYKCDGSQVVCPSACTSDSGCVGSSFCRTSDGTCQPSQLNGGPCTETRQCQSGFCVEGVCCNTPCNGTCQSCLGADKGSGSDGVCGNMAAGKDPYNNCTAQTASTCGTDGFCDGAGACRLYANGTACGATSCSGNSVIGQICNGAGACVQSTGGTDCSPYLCNPTKGTCSTPCATAADCVAGDFCASGVCVLTLPNGQACTGGSQCTTGNCVDGVCCDTACTGTCSACTSAKKGSGSDGSCGPVQAGTDPDSECNDDGATSCGHDGSCDGAGSCQLYAAGTVCGAAACSGTLLKDQICNGLGNCTVNPTGLDCSPFACEAAACVKTCAKDADCASGNFCATTGACTPKLSNSSACTTSAQCTNGFCVDGVCCDQSCTGQCEACDGTTPGVCSPVEGAPHGKRVACTANDVTCGGRCNGITGALCTFPPATTPCGSTCTDGDETDSTCDGEGSCKAGASKACAGGFACGDTGKCNTTCTADKDCASGFACASGGECTPHGSSCLDDHTVVDSKGTSTPCDPYKCSGGMCDTSCTTVDDCVSPNVCNASGRCAPLASAASQGGSCSLGDAPASPGSAVVAALALAAALGRRRRRAHQNS